MKKSRSISAEPNPGILAAIKAVGSQEALARVCGVTQPAVYYWLHKYCPPEHAVAIEEATGVSRKKIRPDLFG